MLKCRISANMSIAICVYWFLGTATGSEVIYSYIMVECFHVLTRAKFIIFCEITIIDMITKQIIDTPFKF